MSQHSRLPAPLLTHQFRRIWIFARLQKPEGASVTNRPSEVFGGHLHRDRAARHGDHPARGQVRIIGGQFIFDWGWHGIGVFLDMLQEQVNRGQGCVDLDKDTTPWQHRTFPVGLTTWKYRAIRRIGDTQIGLWSEALQYLWTAKYIISSQHK